MFKNLRWVSEVKSGVALCFPSHSKTVLVMDCGGKAQRRHRFFAVAL